MSPKNDTNYYIDSNVYIPTKAQRNYAFLAYGLCLKSSVKNGRHCAMLLDKDDNILSTFVNEYSHDKRQSTHAEIGAINAVCNENIKMSECKILVIRGNFLGRFTLSKPCKVCFDAIKKSGISTIIYSTNHNEYASVRVCSQ